MSMPDDSGFNTFTGSVIRSPFYRNMRKRYAYIDEDFVVIRKKYRIVELIKKIIRSIYGKNQ